jgi:hypothetical protein
MSDTIKRAAYPEDVMKAARGIVAEMQPVFEDKIRAGIFDDGPPIQAAARAILAERERCAKVADAAEARMASRLAGLTAMDADRAATLDATNTALCIAAAIRKGDAS